jgi:hypothetical protein
MRRHYTHTHTHTHAQALTQPRRDCVSTLSQQRQQFHGVQLVVVQIESGFQVVRALRERQGVHALLVEHLDGVV